MRHYYVYKIVCPATDRFYYGRHSTSNLMDGYMGSSREIAESHQACEHLHRKEIIYTGRDELDILAVERVIVNEEMIRHPRCMNRIVGGAPDWGDHNRDPKNREYRIKGAINANKTDAKRKRSSEVMSRTASRLHKEGKLHPPDWTGRKHREETKKKIGALLAVAQAGELNSQFGTCWIHNPTTGETKKIKRDDLTLNVALGWKPGRK